MTGSPGGWALEVARGREPGRRFSLPAQACHLGNDLGGVPGIDLSGQEGNSPKRMSRLQAVVEPAGDGGFRLKDQESAGGTFINKQRLQAGSWQTLNEGDLIQLGGVQLKVVRSAGAEAQAKAVAQTTAAFALPVGEGLVCRSWDDVLRASAQRWEALKEELISGRLAAFAHKVGRADLAPDPLGGGSADEQLDAWLGRLPTAKPGQPELEVHPRSVVIETIAGEGAMVRKSVTVSNTGFRLLKVTASVEPSPGEGWLALGRGAVSQTINVVEQATIELVATVPAGGVEGAGKKAVVRLKSNGGEATVEVSLKRSASVVSPPMMGSNGAGVGRTGRGVRDWLANQPVGVRLVRWPLALGVLRLLLAAGDAVVAPVGSAGVPGWAGGALVLAAVGGLAGWFAGKGTAAVDRTQGAFAGAFLGMVVATLAVAVSRAIVAPVVGGSWAAQTLFWGVLGLGLAGLSARLVPERTGVEGVTR